MALYCNKRALVLQNKCVKTNVLNVMTLAAFHSIHPVLIIIYINPHKCDR